MCDISLWQIQEILREGCELREHSVLKIGVILPYFPKHVSLSFSILYRTYRVLSVAAQTNLYSRNLGPYSEVMFLLQSKIIVVKQMRSKLIISEW